MFLQKKLALLAIVFLLITTLSLTIIWYNESNFIINYHAEAMASSLMKDAYNVFIYLFNDADYLSSFVIMNRENIIIPLQIINAESKLGFSQLTYSQLVNRRLIDSYIGSMYGHKYYITGISVVSTSGHLFKIGRTLYYPYELIKKIKEYGIPESERRMVLLPPVEDRLVNGDKQDRFVIPAVRNIMNLDEISVGFVIIYLDYSIIREIFSNNLPSNSIFNVSDRFGNIIFSNVDTEAINIYNNYSYIHNRYYAEKAGWYFDMSIPTSEIRERLNITIRRTILIIFAIASITIALVVYVIHRMTRDYQKLSFAMLEISHGNLDSRTGIEGNDEIGRMGKIFDRMVCDIKELMSQISRNEKQKRKTEIDFLQAQINPHFVSNALNTIIWMAKMNNADNIVSLTKSLVALIRSSIRRGSQFISINDEIEYTKNYVEIQKYSILYDFEIVFLVRDDAGSFFTPRFILQPLVENAIVHGFSEKKENHRIEVLVFSTGYSVLIEIFDNGKGINLDKLEEQKYNENNSKKTYNNIGIKNIQDRIKLFFGGNYSLSFESKENEYTKAILVLPIITESDLRNTDVY
jgi:two-component system sensor histidine kinase YesM